MASPALHGPLSVFSYPRAFVRLSGAYAGQKAKFPNGGKNRNRNRNPEITGRKAGNAAFA
jgi:hypothetical protein